MKQSEKNILGHIELAQWNVYFLIKLCLFWMGYIGLHSLPNLAFAALILIPVSSSFFNVIKQVVLISLAVALFYYDSWLPPFSRLLSEMSLLQSFNAEYLFELMQRFIDIDVVALIVIIWALYLLIGHYIRTGVFIVIYLAYLSSPLQGWFSEPIENQAAIAGQVLSAQQQNIKATDQGGIDLNGYLNRFYQNEKNRSVTFKAPSDNDVPFDILYIHVCSLSWDDLEFASRKNELPQFDILLENFNTASSYSGPAAIRMLRAGCGQSSHAGLYKNSKKQCYLFDNLKKIGFENELVLNHDGHFDDFVGWIKNKGQLKEQPMPLNGLSAPLKSFDGTPVYNDFDTLQRWLTQRESKPLERVVTLYNTITMHDGNRYTDDRSGIGSLKNYPSRLDGLLGDLKEFFTQLEASNKRILVVMIPEHGAGIQGDKMQIPGLREIPSPAISLAPVGLRLFGPELKKRLNPIRVKKPMSYLDVNQMVSKLIESNPFSNNQYQPESLLNDIEGTEFVSENAGTVVIKYNNQYYIRLDGSDDWIEYPN